MGGRAGVSVLEGGGAPSPARKAAAAVSCPQVALRIRPLNDAELEEGATVIAHKVGDQVRRCLGVTELLARMCSPPSLPSRKINIVLKARSRHWDGAERGSRAPARRCSLPSAGSGVGGEDIKQETKVCCWELRLRGE